jgi:rhodanese-related sulfurtransferase
MAKKIRNIFTQFNEFENQLKSLENMIFVLEQRMKNLIEIERNHLIRVKNKEEISDEFIMNGQKYMDLSPERAWNIYSQKDFDFIMIDVSSRDFCPTQRIPEAIHIPWEEFPKRFFEITNKSTPLLIISEDGVNSILACELMADQGYFNCNNISGGYQFWRGFQQSGIKSA